MNKTDEFESLKRKLILTYHQDGILDSMAAVIILGFGLNMLTDNFMYMVVSWLAVLLYMILKQRITIPRFGYVRFESKEKLSARFWFLMGLGIAVFFVFLALSILRIHESGPNTLLVWLQTYDMVPISAILFGLPMLLAAILLGLKRYYFYAMLTVLLPVLGAWFTVGEYLPILAIGIVLLVAGLVLLFGFLRKYPVIADGLENE